MQEISVIDIDVNYVNGIMENNIKNYKTKKVTIIKVFKGLFTKQVYTLPGLYESVLM